VRWGVRKHGSAPVVNARAETAGEKPLFRDAMRRRRCVVVADGFYEWRAQGKTRQPFLFQLADGGPFGIAALWEPPRDDQPETCVLLTTAPNELVGSLHDRMPVLVAPEKVGEWLDPAVEDPAKLSGLLDPFPSARMRMRPVSSRVNDPRHEGPELLGPPEQKSLF